MGILDFNKYKINIIIKAKFYKVIKNETRSNSDFEWLMFGAI